MTVYLEHANMHVINVDNIVNFILQAFPDFSVRHDTGKDDPERWVHVGDDTTYLAVYQAHDQRDGVLAPYSGKPQINHLGFVVDDAEALRDRLLKAGYKETTLPNSHPARKRIYFNDPEGNDWEFIEYLTEDKTQRNDYMDQLAQMAQGLMTR